jgi:Uma2 family endonuclease
MSAERATLSDWLYDDTEEDLVGADWHQDAIGAVVDGLRDCADEHHLPWHVGDQLRLIATKPNGKRWMPSPDVMLHVGAGAARRNEMSVRIDGAPDLIVEVASLTTWQYDVDDQIGKARGYLHLGVPYYLVFDPYGNLMGEPCRAWQQQDGIVRAWSPEPDGRYHAPDLGISFAPEIDRLRVFGPDGKPIAYNYEKAARIRAQDQELRAQAERIAALEAALARLRGET